jgi:hypothetical protein
LTDRLTLYNTALAHIAERKLASLTEVREQRSIRPNINRLLTFPMGCGLPATA